MSGCGSATDLGADGTPTDALARRDALRLRHAVLVSAADAASGAGGYRQLRSELRQISALPVSLECGGQHGGSTPSVTAQPSTAHR